MRDGVTGRVWKGVVAVEKQWTTDRRYIDTLDWREPPLRLLDGDSDAHEGDTVVGHLIAVRREEDLIVADVLFAAHELGQRYDRAADAATHGGSPLYLAALTEIIDARTDIENEGLWMDVALLLGAAITDAPAWPECRIVGERRG